MKMPLRKDLAENDRHKRERKMSNMYIPVPKGGKRNATT